MSNEQEIWKDIPNFEGLYQLSSFKRIKSLKNGKLRKLPKRNVITLCKDGKIIGISIRRHLRILFGIYSDLLDGETWRDVVLEEGFEGLYKVSDFGRVMSLINDKVLNPFSNKYGYRCVLFTRNRIVKVKRINRLVAKAFLLNPENKPEVNHKDGNKLNNHVDNLEWATSSENKIHAFKLGLMKAHNKLKFTDDQFSEIKRRISTGENQYKIAKDYGISQTTVNKISRNKYARS